MTKTEEYVTKAIKKSAKDFNQTTVTGCTVNMPINMGDALKDLAHAMKAQARANEANGLALADLARKIGEHKHVGIAISS